MPEYLKTICRFAVETDFEDLPPGVVDGAKKVLYDTIAAIAAGAQHREPREMARRLGAYSPREIASVIGQKRKMDPLNAALLNGTSGTWLELDEGNQFARGHAGIHVVPAALAVGEEKGVSGKELIAAIVLGYEMACRIGIASKLRMTMHPHGSWGTVGAAVTVGKLMGIDVESMITLVNIASSMTLATSRKTMLEGGTVRNLYAGVSGSMAILAFHLLESGFTGEEDGIGSVYGGVVSDSFNPAAMTEALGSRYEITRNYFKAYACCRYNHSSLDALYRIMKQQKEGVLRPEDVESVHVETYSLAAQLSSRKPRNMLAAKFSIPFAIATTVVHGHSGVESFLPEKAEQKEIQELAARVQVEERAEFTQMMPARRPSRVTVRLKNGETFTETVWVSKGDLEDPYTEEELDRKFIDLTGPIYGLEKAKEILDRAKRVESYKDVRTFTEGF